MPIWDLSRFRNNPRVADRDPDADFSDETSDEVVQRMNDYTTWRKMFNGQIFKEEMPDAPKDGKEHLRWPTKLNLYKAYSLLYAAMMVGRAQSPRDTKRILGFSVKAKVPGLPIRELTASARLLQDALTHWWSFNEALIRPLVATQQWAGGCIIELAWNPAMPNAVYGVTMDVIEPDFFWPVYDPTNPRLLLSCYIAFQVSVEVAMEKYGLTKAQAQAVQRDDRILVTKYWSRREYWTKLGPKRDYVARFPSVAGAGNVVPQAGPNPWRHPVNNYTVIPVFYIPRIWTGSGFFGDSLMPDLDGPVKEINKTLADIGDAMTDSTHISGAVADMTSLKGNANSLQTIQLPQAGFVNLGKTPAAPSAKQANIWFAPSVETPRVTEKFMGDLADFTDLVAFFTPAARGRGGAESGFQAAMSMMPTTGMLDWMRGHWADVLTGRGGICETLGIIWFVKAEQGQAHRVPSGYTPHTLLCENELQMRAMIPQDRMAIVQEVAQLAANKAAPPRYLLERLGDIENVPEAFGELATWLVWLAAWDAARAGHQIKIGGDLRQDDKQVSLPRPELVGESEAQKQPMNEPQQAAKEKTQ